MLSNPEYFKSYLIGLLQLKSPMDYVVVLLIGCVAFKIAFFIYNSFCTWMMKKTSSFYLFIINGTTKMVVPKWTPIKMPANTEKPLFGTMWLLLWFNSLSILINISSNIPIHLRVKTSYIFFISYFLLRLCNSFVNDNEQQPPVKEDDFWDNVFKVFKSK